MSQGPRSAGGIRIKTGHKAPAKVPFSRKDAADMRDHCNSTLGSSSVIRLRHFSQFDHEIAQLPEISPDQACSKAVVLLGEVQAAGWHGVRPQLASLLLLLSQMARQDGYSIRVVAETALMKANAR